MSYTPPLRNYYRLLLSQITKTARVSVGQRPIHDKQHMTYPVCWPVNLHRQP